MAKKNVTNNGKQVVSGDKAKLIQMVMDMPEELASSIVNASSDEEFYKALDNADMTGVPDPRTDYGNITGATVQKVNDDNSAMGITPDYNRYNAISDSCKRYDFSKDVLDAVNEELNIDRSYETENFSPYMARFYDKMRENNMITADRVAGMVEEAVYNATRVALDYITEAMAIHNAASMSEMCKIIDKPTK